MPISPKHLGAALAATLTLGACSEYLDRRDGILLGVGDAVGTNITTHTIDPWPASARNVYADTDGERAQRAIERYRNPQAGSGGLGGGPAAAAAALAPTAPPSLVR